MDEKRENVSLPPMKFEVGETVEFKLQGKWETGVVFICDWGGSIEHDYHSYDIENAEENILYKHIPERDVRKTNQTKH